MKMNILTVPIPRKLILVAMTVAAMAATTAQSQGVDTSAWQCEFCPFEGGNRADYALGATNVSDDSAYLGDASGYSEEGVYANVDGEGSYVSDGHQLRWLVEDLGLDSRYAEIAGGRQGTLDYNLSYREIPRTQYFTTNTIFQQSAADTLSLPTGWVRAADTSGLTELDASLARRDIESDRSILQIGGRYLATNRISISADYSRQEKQGVDIGGGSYFFQSSLLARPIDYVTDAADFGVRYAADNGFLSLGWYFSNFDNDNDATNWENPFTSAPGSEFAAAAQAPGNNFNQLSLSGGFSFSQYRTVMSFSAAAGRMSQNKAFLPYTTNANVAVAPLPRLSLDGEVDTSNFAFSLNSKVFNKARVRLAFRYDERDNGTAQDLWSGVTAETFVSGTKTNTPYSFERSTLNLSADYDLFDTVRISGGYDRKTMDRDFQEVAGQTEDGSWGRLLWRPNGILRFDVKGGAYRREIDSYDETFAATLGQNPLMRKYNLAFRYRTFGELTFVASFPESPVTITLNGLYADDSYTQSRMGLISGEELRITGDLSWALGDRSSLYLTGGYENIESEQFGSELFAREDWNASNNDNFYTAGGGFRAREIGGKLDLQLDYTRSEGTSEIDIASTVSGQSQFPDLESTFDYLRLLLSYQQSERLALTLNLRYQSFLAEDWALEGVAPDTIPSVLTLGAQPYDEDMMIIGLGFRYSIGGSGDASSY
jgi:MtrB/PioB family decaheme-associated outer membrane protein